jgi:hypothetical protein
MAYFYLSNTSLTTGVISLTDTNRTFKTLDYKRLVNPGASTYHYEGWIFVETLPSAQKVVFWKDSAGLTMCLKGSTMTICDGIAPTADTGSITEDSSKNIMTVTDKFPQQKWVYFVINVINKNILEVYLNGKLIKTQQLAANITNATRGSLNLGGTAAVAGYVTKFKRDPVALLPDEVWTTYLAGNGLATFTNWLAGYNASFTISSGATELKKVSLFTPNT